MREQNSCCRGFPLLYGKSGLGKLTADGKMKKVWMKIAGNSQINKGVKRSRG